jgi:LEA14-like dessication related protein
MKEMKMGKKIFSKIGLIMVVCASFSLTTCQTLSSIFQDPILSLQSVEIAKIGFTGADLLCKVKVENPNPIDIPFPEIGWEFFINTNSFIAGTLKSDQSLKSRKSTVIDVVVSFNYLEVFNTFKSLKGTKQADYKVALAAKIPLPIMGDKIFNFEHSGTFPVLQMPKLSMPAMKFDKLDFTKAELVFEVNIENPNSFDIPSPKMAYEYLVNKNSFIHSSIDSAAPLAAAAITAVPIRITVNYAELFQKFAALKSLGEAPGLLSLKSDFSIPAFADESSVLSETGGSLPLLKVPSISFKGVSVKNISLTNIDIGISWEVENTNNFAMSVKDLSFNFAVNRTQWASGKVPGSPQVAAGRKTEIPLTISINSLSMVKDITEIITKGTDISYVCGGNVNLGMALPALDDFGTPFNFTGTTKLRR